MNKPDIKKCLTSILFGMLPLFANASFPKCDGVENWPASMAFVQLKNQKSSCWRLKNLLKIYTLKFTKFNF